MLHTKNNVQDLVGNHSNELWQAKQHCENMSGSHYPGALLVLSQRTVCTHSNPPHIYPVNNSVTGANSISSRPES